MRYSQQPPAFGSAPARLHVTPWVKRLLIVNGVVFVVIWAMSVTRVFDLAQAFDLFAFSPTRIWVRPWGILTYMFLHAGLWHLLMNMLIIFFFGPPLESRWGSSIFIKFYLICGLGGVLLSFLFSNSSIVGASAACYGMMLAFAMLWPNTNVYIWGLVPVRVKWLVLFLVGLSFVSAIGPNRDGIAHLAHLGGAVAGFLMMKSGLLPTFAPAAARRRDWGPGAIGRRADVRAAGRNPRTRGRERSPRGTGPRTRWWDRFSGGTGPRSSPNRQRRNWSVQSGGASPAKTGSPRKRAEVQARQVEELDRVDAVLDKISSMGIDSLTTEERDLLDRVSRQTRTN